MCPEKEEVMTKSLNRWLSNSVEPDLMLKSWLAKELGIREELVNKWRREFLKDPESLQIAEP